MGEERVEENGGIYLFIVYLFFLIYSFIHLLFFMLFY